MSEPFLHGRSKTGGLSAAGFPNVCRTPNDLVPVSIPYPTQAAQGGAPKRADKGDILALANAVDARAANGNLGARIAQGRAIQSLGQNGGAARSATQAVLMGRSTLKRSAGNEPGTMKSIATQSVVGPRQFPVLTSKVHIGGGPITIMGGAGMVDFTDTKVDPGEAAKATQSSQAPRSSQSSRSSQSRKI